MTLKEALKRKATFCGGNGDDGDDGGDPNPPTGDSTTGATTTAASSLPRPEGPISARGSALAIERTGR